MKVAIITQEQRDLLVCHEYAPDCVFNPIRDIDDNWIISPEEIAQTIFPDFLFVKDLPLTDYKPKPFIEL